VSEFAVFSDTLRATTPFIYTEAVNRVDMSEKEGEPTSPLGGDEVSEDFKERSRELAEREKDVLDRLK
jgi:hypothetical protein